MGKKNFKGFKRLNKDNLILRNELLKNPLVKRIVVEAQIYAERTNSCRPLVEDFARWFDHYADSALKNDSDEKFVQGAIRQKNPYLRKF